MKKLTKIILVNFLLVVSFASVAVQADPLDDARSAGHIVELANGYVKASASAPAKAKALAVQVNKRRKDAYTRIAKKNGITVGQVATESYKQRVNN